MAKPTLKSIDPTALEAGIQKLLAEKKFRKARDQAKILGKTDKQRALPLLIEANAGLCSDMLDRGQTSEAKEVLTHLKTFATADQFARLSYRVHEAFGDSNELGEAAIRLLNAPGLPQEERPRLTDVAVAHCPENLPPELAASGPGAVIWALRCAMKKSADGDLAGARAELEPVPDNGPSSDWKVFVEGLLLLYEGNRGKALETFRRIPQGSAAGRAAEPLIAVLTSNEPGLQSAPETLGFLTSMAGAPELGPRLNHCRELLLNGRIKQAVEELERYVPGFPSDGGDFPGAVATAAFQTAHIGTPGARIDQVQAECDQIARTHPSAFIRLLAARLAAAHAAKMENSDNIGAAFDRYLTAAVEWFGDLPVVRSTVLTSRSEAYEQVADLEQAIASALDSANADPESDLPLRLLYELADRTRSPGLLEATVQLAEERFPETAFTHFVQAQLARDQGRLEEALQLFQKTKSEEPDIPVNGHIAETKLTLAQGRFDQGSPEEGRKAWEDIHEYAGGRDAPLINRLWTMRAEQALIELTRGDPQESEKFLSLAFEAANSKTLPCLFALQMWPLYGQEKPFPWEAELNAALEDVGPGDIEELLEVFSMMKTPGPATLRILIRFLKRDLTEVIGENETVTGAIIRFARHEPRAVHTLMKRILERYPNNLAARMGFVSWLTQDHPEWSNRTRHLMELYRHAGERQSLEALQLVAYLTNKMTSTSR